LFKGIVGTNSGFRKCLHISFIKLQHIHEYLRPKTQEMLL